VSGGYVTVKGCDGTAVQTWTVYNGDESLNYSTKYTIVSGSLCLGLSAPNSSLPAWSTITVAACTGSTAQKWNASANTLVSTLKNTHEN
jgi:hypothetical protein